MRRLRGSGDGATAKSIKKATTLGMVQNAIFLPRIAPHPPLDLVDRARDTAGEDF